MSVAAAIRRMMDAGLSVEQALLAAEAFEAEQKPVVSSGAERTRRWRQKKASHVTSQASQNVTVTDVTPPEERKVSPCTPSKETLPQEEHPSPPPVVRAPRAEIGHFLPQDWKPKQENIDWAAVKLGSMDAASESFAAFRDFWFAKAGKDGRKRDWDGTWRNWVREDVRRGSSRNGNRSAAPRPGAHDTIFAAVGELLDGLPDGGRREAGAAGAFDAERDGAGVYRLSG